ncbi:hypothetical protein OH76DRAFT_1489905 [Lentinus brumalis]|uniref:Uncharacterized protein n=1 Tax=Lentinus brumalis TaxID=2498619 RepID=A0A371CKV2_9APHY|nr:hypothetical protein OH76DRAFT_1489905 [Polyporus brumalis]
MTSNRAAGLSAVPPLVACVLYLVFKQHWLKLFLITDYWTLSEPARRSPSSTTPVCKAPPVRVGPPGKHAIMTPPRKVSCAAVDTSCAPIRGVGTSSLITPSQVSSFSTSTSFPHAHDSTLNIVIAELPDKRVMLVLVEDPCFTFTRIRRDSSIRRGAMPGAQRGRDSSDSMESRIALSELLNVLESIGAQARGPLTDHHDEGQAIRTSGQRRSSSGRTRTAATVLHRASLILPNPESPHHHSHRRLHPQLPPALTRSPLGPSSASHTSPSALARDCCGWFAALVSNRAFSIAAPEG